MRRLLVVLAAVVALVAIQPAGEVRANCSRPDSPGVFAFETITVSNASIGFTAATISPTSQEPAYAALVSVEADALRWRADGVAPTAAIGHQVAVGQTIEVCGTKNVRDFRMIRVTTDATVRVSYFR